MLATLEWCNVSDYYLVRRRFLSLHLCRGSNNIVLLCSLPTDSMYIFWVALEGLLGIDIIIVHNLWKSSHQCFEETFFSHSTCSFARLMAQFTSGSIWSQRSSPVFVWCISRNTTVALICTPTRLCLHCFLYSSTVCRSFTVQLGHWVENGDRCFNAFSATWTTVSGCYSP